MIFRPFILHSDRAGEPLCHRLRILNPKKLGSLVHKLSSPKFGGGANSFIVPQRRLGLRRENHRFGDLSPVAALGMCRLLCMCCVFALLWGAKSVYAQNATVPVTIILEGPSGTALPIPVVSRTNLTVKPGGSGKTFTVSLSSEPLEETTVSWGLNDDDLPPGGEERDLDMSLESFIFTSENWDEEQPVTVTAETYAEMEEYLITFEITGNSGGGGVGSTLPEITVTVEDWLEIDFASPWKVYEGRFSRWPVTLTLEEGFTAPVTVTLSIPNKPDYLHVDQFDWVLRFNDYPYGLSRNLRLNPLSGFVAGEEYQFFLTVSSAGYNDIRREGIIRTLLNPCTPNIRIIEGELDFGAWNRPEEESLEGSITVNSTTGLGNGGINMTLVGEEPTAAKWELTTENCGGCRSRIDYVHSSLRRQGSNKTIDFTMEYSRWIDDRLRIDRGSKYVASWLFNPDGKIHTHQFGGTISGISGDESVTPVGVYQGEIGVKIFCY